MLTVWCVKVGDKYTDADVLMLKSQVKRHLSKPHDFWCLSDRKATANTVILRDAWPGWWTKLKLFRFAGEGRHLYIDLDSVIVGISSRCFRISYPCPRIGRSQDMAARNPV
ncbi:MAG: hypothetical protein IPG20_21405 [Gammaproteobacteria bacterium]|nr:hypothetical protein [Gammaproteobacteria bacterium]